MIHANEKHHSKSGVGKLRPERLFYAARRHLQKLYLLFWLNTLHDKIFVKLSCRYLTLLLERVPFGPVRLMQAVMVFMFYVKIPSKKMSKTKKKKRSKAYNIMKTVKEQNIIQPKTTKTKKKTKQKKRSKMLRYVNKKGPRLSKLRKVFAPGPPWHWNHHWMQGSYASPGHQSVK